MQLYNLAVLLLPVLGVSAAPGFHRTKSCTTTTTKATTTTSTPTPSPTPGTYGVIAARSASPIHLLSLNAAGQRFYLGGETSSYCPSPPVQNCPPGNRTVLAGTCALSVLVPGGQQIYASPDGYVGYTQAHSASIPTGAQLCPLTWTKNASENFGHLSSSAFGATGLMACPTGDGRWQVFLAIKNAKVPTGKVSDCLGFDALTADTAGLQAWQYT